LAGGVKECRVLLQAPMDDVHVAVAGSWGA